MNYENMQIENINNFGVNELLKLANKSFEKEIENINFENIDFNIESFFNYNLLIKNKNI